MVRRMQKRRSEEGHWDALSDELRMGRETLDFIEHSYSRVKLNKYDSMYMDFAIRASQESKCPRKQVGCVTLLNSGIISIGFNGHASGGPNEWDYMENGNPEVVHAELNSLGKLLEEGISCKDATVYLTLSPCLDCSKLLVRAKVKRVVYLEEYRCSQGLNYLRKYGVTVEQFAEDLDWGF